MDHIKTEKSNKLNQAAKCTGHNTNVNKDQICTNNRNNNPVRIDEENLEEDVAFTCLGAVRKGFE